MVESVHWRDYVKKLSTPWMLRQFGERLFGSFGVIADTASEGAKLALLANWLLEPTSPDDVLPKIGRERRLQRYPAETPAQHRARLHKAWDTWVAAGSHQNMIAQFAAAGWPGVVILDNTDIYQWESPHDSDYHSRFWVVMPPESHSFVTDGIWDDPGTWSDGGLWDSGNATFEQIQTMRGIIRKFKPVDWRCFGIIAVLTWDAPTLTNADDFSHGDWAKGLGTTVTADDIAGPEPATFGDRIENTSGFASSVIRVGQTPGNVQVGRPTHFFFTVKAGTTNWVALRDDADAAAWFDLENGTIVNRTTAAEIESLGDGWYRCSVATLASFLPMRLHVVDGNGSLSCSDGAYVYAYQAEVHNYKYDEHILFGAG